MSRQSQKEYSFKSMSAGHLKHRVLCTMWQLLVSFVATVEKLFIILINVSSISNVASANHAAISRSHFTTVSKIKFYPSHEHSLPEKHQPTCHTANFSVSILQWSKRFLPPTLCVVYPKGLFYESCRRLGLPSQLF